MVLILTSRRGQKSPVILNLCAVGRSRCGGEVEVEELTISGRAVQYSTKLSPPQIWNHVIRSGLLAYMCLNHF